MAPPILGPDDRATISELLGEADRATGETADLAAAAAYWCNVLDPALDRDATPPTYEPADLQTVAWLLRDLSTSRRLPGPTRDRARYWAAWIEGRLTLVEGA